MSLNGLDDVKVKEAHEVAAVEPGGWFLLKYVSRDEIELLGKGNGGIVEIRKIISQFEEPAPLYGFLRYRRRNVVIKYVPEDCSRLVQARVAVHFNAVKERFPHHTEFSIASSKELRDTRLSAACSLHTASGSISSSTSSLRRRRLMEIAEDAEEDAKRQSTVPEERSSPTTAPSITAASVPLPASPPTLTPADSYRSVISDLDTFPPPPRDPQPEFRPRTPNITFDERRNSSQSTRPALYSMSSHGSGGRPKIKLGPRPSLDVGGKGRQNNSNAASHYRPVATLPEGLKLLSRTSKTEKERPKSHVLTDLPSVDISPPQVSDAVPVSLQLPQMRPHTSSGRPTTSSGVSVKPATGPKLPTMTPEKARLMKALELRKKREMASLPSATAPDMQGAGEQVANTTAEMEPSTTAPEDVNDTSSTVNDVIKADDSGVAFDISSTMKADESDATRSDSCPVSPVGPSEQAESTQASSISESTDETVQESYASKALLGETEAVEGNIPTEEQSEETDELVQDKCGELEDLLLLKPVAYNPAQSPAITETKQLEENASKKVEESTPARKTLGEETMTEDSTQADVPSNVLLSETDGAVSTAELPNAEDDITLPAETFVLPTSPIKPEVKEWKVPRSKFSSQNLRAESEGPAIPSEPRPLSPSGLVADSAPKSPVESTFSDANISATEDDQQSVGPLPSKRRKRKGLIEPIRTDLEASDISAGNSEANFSSDDELMQELQSAVLQEAMPISVSKSPASPVFPSPQKQSGNRFSRVFSSPMSKATSDPQKISPREMGRVDSSRSVSASTAYLNRVNSGSAKPLATKVNLGSGISQRIKALEKLSANSPGASTGTTAPSTGASPTFFSVRKGSVRAASRSPSIAERADSLTRNTPSPSPSASRDSSPETLRWRERSGSVQSRLSAFSAVPTPQAQQSRAESVTVTARIIRDPNQPFPIIELGKDPSEYTPLDLKNSPLVIDHQKAIVASPSPPKETLLERRLSTSSRTTTKSRRSSVTIVKDLIKEGRASYAERRRSMDLKPSVASPSRPPSVHKSPAHQRPMSVGSRHSSRDTASSAPPTVGSFSTTNEEKDKKSNRASRILKGISSSFASTRKSVTNGLSPTVREDPEPTGPDSRSPTSSHPSSHSTIPSTTSTSIGEVNVQFPDSLLWKRRSMLLDSQGFLILSTSLSNGNNAKEKTTGGSMRRFHLSEFRKPGVPDVEMQELPNSVVFDFVEGGGLQIACEDRAGQARVLGVLQDAHRTWAAYGQ